MRTFYNQTDITIVFDAIDRRLSKAASDAMRATAEATRLRARDYAPVRDVFKHGRSRTNRSRYYGTAKSSYSRALRTETVPGSGSPRRAGSMNFAHPSDPLRTEGVKRGVKRRGDRWRRVDRRYDTEVGQQRFLEAFHRQRPRNVQMMAQGLGLGAERPEDSNLEVSGPSLGRVRSHARAFNPILGTGRNRVYVPAARRISEHGELRLIKGRDDIRLPKQTAYSETRKPRDISVESLLSRKGRWEIKRAARIARRLQATRSFSNEAFGAELQKRGYGVRVVRSGSKTSVVLGGRLRDSIKQGPIVEDEDEITVDIYTDPDEQDYAGYQEYGTSRHPAQPFMRPALYEARVLLRKNLEKSLR
jgi:HK97 gp10 family phage protein